ncbi:MAG: MBL fold metallo-hydrolase [Chloroflexi bacterium]|nr:MBL fold metallo-hydrolase [Chloroflexota bacterium]
MRIHTLFTGVANTHLMETEHGVVIIDAGIPHMTRRILSKIRVLGHSPKEVRLILITHGHIDHAGSAVALKRITGAPIAMHRDDIRLTTTPSLKIPPGRNRATNRIGAIMRAFGFVMPLETFSPDISLDDGQSLDEFDFPARAWHTPGHTAGSMTIVTNDGEAFVGDSILNLLHVSFPLFWENPTAAHESACRIQSLQPRVCYSGHGKPFALNELTNFVGEHCE